MGRIIKEFFTTIISDTSATQEYNNPYTMSNSTIGNGFHYIYVAFLPPHDSYPETVLGYFDTAEEAEQAILRHGIGGRIEQTTWDELTSMHF